MTIYRYIAAIWVFQSCFLLADELAPWRGHMYAPAGIDEPKLSVTYLGISTLLFDDGENQLLVDGYFTRPDSWLDYLRPYGSDRKAVDRALATIGADQLSAVLVAHSHFDHAVDSACVAETTGAKLVGTESTANIGRGWGLGEEYILVPEFAQKLSFGAFTVSMYESRHAPLMWKDMDHEPRLVEEPLLQPDWVWNYREGGSVSWLIEHPSGNVIVQGSGGFVKDALAGISAHTVFLGVGGIGRLSPEHRAGLYRELVSKTGAKRVFPIHYETLAQPIDSNDITFIRPGFMDDFAVTWDDLYEAASNDGVELKLLPQNKRLPVF